MHYIRRVPKGNKMNSRTRTETGHRTIEIFDSFKIFKTVLGGDQLYLSASVTDFSEKSELTTERIYKELAARLLHGEYEILHERIFASLSSFDQIVNARHAVMASQGYNEPSPLTFIQGHPVGGRGLAGIQLRAFKPTRPTDKVWTTYEKDFPVGKGWTRNGASFQIVQNGCVA